MIRPSKSQSGNLEREVNMTWGHILLQLTPDWGVVQMVIDSKNRKPVLPWYMGYKATKKFGQPAGELVTLMSTAVIAAYHGTGVAITGVSLYQLF
jgi:hypothetical protein|tara:strand:- start:357 stop:641 length:285 start_codon:yes stop_codon:yes gene_type:complete